MIHEFALEPAVINNWERFRYFVDQFGVEHGRLISRFPHRWKAMVYDECKTCKEIEKKRIEERLANIDNKLISLGRPYIPEKRWLDNAEEQHDKKPFRAIISTSNPREKPHVLIADDLDETYESWRMLRGCSVPRTPESLANSAAMLLLISKEIVFVDPYFDPGESRFINTLRKLLQHAFENLLPDSIELHVKHRVKRKDNYYASRNEILQEWHDKCLQRLPPIIPRGFKIKIIRWDQRDGGEKLHARYVLTEKGGIGYDVGLDSGYEGETTDVSLLDRPVYEQRWKDYQKETAPFELVDEFVVQGNKKPNS